jgi:hypothetical protein
MQQSSVEYLHIHLTGPDAASLTAGQVEVSAVTAGAPAVWCDVDSYDPSTGTAKALYGPGTDRGALPVGQVDIRARITDTPEVIVTDPFAVYVHA